MIDRTLLQLPGGSAEEAARVATSTSGMAGFAVGSDLIAAAGPGVVGAISRIGPAAVTWGLHGSPIAVAESARHLAGFGASWILVHATSGREAMAAARDAVTVEVVALLVEPTMGDPEVAALGLGRSRGRLVSRLAREAASVSITAVTCSLPDLGVVADVAPGVRRIAVGVESAAGIEEALERGADLVIAPGDVTP